MTVRQLGYGFVPVPHWLMGELRSGSLSYPDFVILAYLYFQARHDALSTRAGSTPSMTLAQLAEGIAWTQSHDALSKRLRRLRDRPDRLLSYRVESRSRYVFTLYPDDPEKAEPRPSPSEDSRPSIGSPQAEAATCISTRYAAAVSEVRKERRRDHVRDTAHQVRDPDTAQLGFSTALPPTDDGEHVRDPQTSQTLNPSSTKEESQAATEQRESAADFGDPNWEASIAELNALAASGFGDWVVDATP